MKKTLIAAAVSTVIALPAIAQADVTLYGKFEPSIDYINTNTSNGVTGANGNTNKSVSGFTLNSSRWGIKGTHDLGEGLKAIFQVESSITANAKAKIGNRNTFVGLAGGFGTVIAGRHDTPMKSLGQSVNLFADQIGDARNLTRGTYSLYDSNTSTYIANGSKGFNQRLPDMVAYVTPAMGGFKVVAQYGFDGGTNNASFYDLMGKYKMGPLMVGLAYESHGKGLYASNNTGTGGTATETNKDETGVRLAGSYKVGAFKVVGLIEQLNNLGGYENIGGVSTNPKAEATVYGLGGKYTMGMNAIKAQVYQANPKGSNNNSTMFALGFDHSFTHKVMAYVDYAVMNNQSGANMDVWHGGHTTNYVDANNNTPTVTVAHGKDPYAVSAGMMIKF